MSALQLQGTAKLQQVKQLLSSLEKDLQDQSLTTTERVQTLLQLRQHGTDPRNAGPIYSQNGINTLARYGVEGETADVRRAALRCVANALFLDAPMRQVFVNTGYGGKLADKLNTDESEDEMVTCRILFFTTYGTTMDFEDLVKNHALGDNVAYQMSRHAKQFPKLGRTPLSQMDELALTDALKLIYNVTKIYAKLSATFLPCIPHILKIISRVDISDKPLDGMPGSLVNALSILMEKQEKEDKAVDESPLFPTFDPNCNVNRLISILDRAVSLYSPQELETKAIPLLQSLISIYEVAPEVPRGCMRSLLLPESSDRSLPIGKTDSLSSKLLNFLTGHYAHLKVAVSEMMFLLSDKDAETLIKNIGYGFAAGFLAARAIPIPGNAGEVQSGATEADLNSLLNPVTGQRLTAEPRDNLPPMTQAEKEREAERLMVLFERAKANGHIAQHPMEQALNEGRFEELSDDADSD